MIVCILMENSLKATHSLLTYCQPFNLFFHALFLLSFIKWTGKVMHLICDVCVKQPNEQSPSRLTFSFLSILQDCCLFKVKESAGKWKMMLQLLGHL